MTRTKNTNYIWTNDKLEQLRQTLLTAKNWHEVSSEMDENIFILRTYAYKNKFPRLCMKQGGDRRSKEFRGLF